jgi:opacity protein-like surface antigen
MRRMIFLAIGLFLFSIPSFAQEVAYPKAEVFGGFSITSASFPPALTGLTSSLRETFWGWQASGNFNVTNHLGIVGDFGGQYKSISTPAVGTLPATSLGMNNYQLLFGPQFSFRRPKVTPFVHALFGFDRFGASFAGVGGSTTGFGMGVGGGLDVNLSDRFALRVPQFDWTPTHIGGVWEKNVIRIGIGVVIKAGGK